MAWNTYGNTSLTRRSMSFTPPSYQACSVGHDFPSPRSTELPLLWGLKHVNSTFWAIWNPMQGFGPSRAARDGQPYSACYGGSWNFVITYSCVYNPTYEWSNPHIGPVRETIRRLVSLFYIYVSCIPYNAILYYTTLD